MASQQKNGFGPERTEPREVLEEPVRSQGWRTGKRAPVASSDALWARAVLAAPIHRWFDDVKLLTISSNRLSKRSRGIRCARRVTRERDKKIQAAFFCRRLAASRSMDVTRAPRCRGPRGAGARRAAARLHGVALPHRGGPQCNRFLELIHRPLLCINAIASGYRGVFSASSSFMEWK